MIYVSSDYLEGANPICRLWIFTEIVALIVELPYVMFVHYQKQLIQNPLPQSKEDSQVAQDYTTIQAEESLVNKPSKKEELQEILAESKKTLDYEEDFFAMTVLCHLKSNTNKYMIHPSK